MKTRPLSRSGRHISEIGFGGWAIGGDQFEKAYGPVDDNVSRQAVRQALESGITFFDTADIYGHGHSEAILGKALAEWPDRESLTLCTKGGINFYRPGELPEPDYTPYALANAVEQSRARLRVDSIDLYLLMNPPRSVLLESDRVWETLAALRRAGKIRSVGVSINDPQDGVDLLKAGILVDAIEVAYSLFFQSASLELFPLARKNRVSIVAREPLANGFLAADYASRRFGETDHRSLALPEYTAIMGTMYNKLKFLENPNRTMAQAALRFVLDHPAVTVAIPGMRTAAQVTENCGAAGLAPLTDAERSMIHSVFFPEDQQ